MAARSPPLLAFVSSVACATTSIFARRVKRRVFTPPITRCSSSKLHAAAEGLEAAALWALVSEGLEAAALWALVSEGLEAAPLWALVSITRGDI